MQKIFFTVFIYALLGISTGFAQTVNFEDGFEDGDFTNAPAWSGDTGEYTVVDGTPNFLLQSQGNPGGGVSYLSTPSTNAVGSWEFYMNLDFSPSDGNRADIFLMSDIANLEGALNGYALRGGEGGSSDVFRIVRYDGGSEAGTPVLSGTTDISGGGAFRVKVTRQTGGTWTLEVGQGYDGALTQEGGAATDNTYTTTNFFGVRSTYTGSRANLFTYDFKIDLPPFTITNASGDADSVDVTFNRAPDQSTVQPADFSINNGVGSPASVSFPSSQVARLKYSSALASNEYTLTAQNIQDQSGTSINANASASFIVFADFAPGDVIINEFVYDPGSNQSEYVELKNLSGKYLNLQNWKIGDDSGNNVISTNTVALQPNDFLVISKDTTTLNNTYGSRNYIQPGSVPSFNNSGGDVVKILTGGDSKVDSLYYDKTWGGSGVSLERRSDTAPPIQANFGDSPNALGGTPGLANEVADDTTPPSLDNLIITDNQTLDLDFSERLANGPATNTSNYTLDNGITVNNAQQTADDSVRLSLSAPLQNGTEYQLSITNQQDIFGNTAAQIDTSFTFYVVSPADSGDIFINEFTYDPPEGSTEYIELYNPTNKSFDLNGWTINDNTGNLRTITGSQFIVPPDSFVVLAPDNTLLTDNPDIALVNMGTGFPSLNNNGDDIVLRDSSGTRLDSLRFTSDWGGNRVALERRTTDVRPIQANFGDAPNGFGTPGRQNQIGNDTTPPDLKAFSIVNNQLLEFVFTEQVESQSATNVNNYSLSGSITINSATQAGGDTVRVGLSGPLQNNTSYTATIDGVQDLFGNTLNNRDTTFTYYETTPADSGDIFINEFTYDPPEGSTEYIELYNPTNESFDLNGWTVNDNTGNLRTITGSQYIIPPDSFVVLAPDNTLLTDNPSIALITMGSRFPSLNNSGDDIVLRDSSGTLLDSLRYTSDWGGHQVALERRTTNVAPIQANFGDAPNGFGTPDRQNQIGNDTTPPDLSDLAAQDRQTLDLAFTEDLNSTNANNANNYTLDNGITVADAQQTAPDSVRLSLNNPLQNGTTYQLTIDNQQDIFGNTAATIDTTFQFTADTTPPKLTDINIPDNQTLTLSFSENLSSGPATTSANYTLNNGIGVSNAQQLAGDTIQLSLDASLQNATQYQLSINNQQDAFGNTAAIDTSFTYFQASPADSGDIFINEFTYDPPSGSTEYIELYNTSTKSLNLQNWTINDNRGDRRIITDSRAIVPPDSFVVLAPDRSLQDSLPNIALVAMGSRFPSLNNSGDDIVLRDSSGTRLDSLTYTSAFGGNNVAVERRTTNAPPVQSNFGDAPNGFGTPGTQNQIGNDATPPNLTDLGIPDSQTLTLAFSEGLAEGPATTPGNYTFDNGITVSTAQQTAEDSVRLNLSPALQNGTTYQLSINNQQDIFGNTTARIDTSFTYFETTPADSGDIFINEFTYDPPSGSTEYIELKNTTTQSFDLNGWTLNDNRGTPRIITNSRAIVPPDSFVVIAEDNTLLANYPDINLVTMGGQFPSLNNSGDDIVLRNASGVRLDSLTYTSAFGGNNVAVERRTTNAPPIQANFGPAPNGFGTPGSANQIQPDNQPPIVNSTRILDSSTIRLIFSETITAETATNQNNYSISPSRGIQLISSVQDTVTLLLSQQLQSEQPYQLAIQNLEDVFGNAIADTTLSLNFVAFSQPQPGDIVINEFLPTSPEFVELYNTTDKNFDLSNWVIGDASNTATIDAGPQLLAGEYIVLTESSSLANLLGDDGVFLSDLPSLDNDEDVIYVQTDNGTTVDSLSYTPAFGGSIDGKSAERIDPGGASNDASNFTTSTADDGSTPGAKNSVFMLDESSPTIVFSRIFPNGDIEVRFSEFISLTPDVSFLLGDQTLTVDSFNPSNGNVIFLNTPSGTATGTDLTVTAQNLSDVKGNTTASTQLAVSQPLTPGDVVINEILFDPLSDSDDNKPDQSEYIEIRNIRDYAITLENITLHDAPDENGEVRSLTPVSTTSKYIPAQGTALIYAEDATSVFGQSKVAQFFNIQNATSNSVIRIDRSSLSLASSGDAIYLAGGNGATIDSVFYDETWHNPNLVDTDGVSLERINPLGPSNNDSNWGSSTAETGGTPNQENTLFESPQQGGQQEIGISFSANPFSPDGDGIDENLLINYKLDQPDFLITVRIYDRYGRLVRELADGKQAGLQGSLIWDGLKDNGDHNRIGIYIVIFKAFDSASGNNKAFKKTVVLARRLN